MKKLIAAGALFFLLAGLLASPVLAEDDGWEMVMDKNGIKAYVRDVPGSDIKEVRAVTTVDATLENIGEVLRDVPANAEWLPHCEVSELLTMHHRNKLDLYVKLDLPWPVSDVDMVINSDTTYDLDAGRAIVKLTTGEDPRKPETDDAVRIKDFTGTYVFEYIDRYKTGIIYTYRVDLAGHIPAWLMNFMGKYTLYDTFKNLRKMVKKEKYIQAGLTCPDREVCERILNNQEKIRTVFRTRLSEFIGDQEFIDQVVAEDAMLARFFNAENPLALTLLYGWGSEESKKEAIRQLLAAYLPMKMEDARLAAKMADDDTLVEAILTGDGQAMEMIQAQVGGKTAEKKAS